MIYLIAGIVLVACELMIGTLWLLVVGLSSLIVAALYYAIPGFGGVHQAVAMIALALLSPLVVKRLQRFRPHNDATLNKPLARYVGQLCHAENDFESGRGRVILNGSTWSAVVEGGHSCNAGQRLEVVSAGSDGILVVRIIE